MLLSPVGVGTIKRAISLLTLWLEPELMWAAVQLAKFPVEKLSENTVKAAEGFSGASKRMESNIMARIPSNFLFISALPFPSKIKQVFDFGSEL